MAGTVATGEVVLVAKMPGVKKTIEEQLGAPVEEINKQSAHKGAMIFGGTWSKAVKGLGLGATLAAGVAIKGGWDRAMQKDQAIATLKGLGHSTESVTAIMDNALASVKGTAFGMGEAATVAASSVAAGVKPGQDLERTLKLTADAATIAGSSMGEMGAIFNKVAANDKLQMDSINQLQDRGIPILDLVAKQMGVTREEAAKMASDGKINFDTFRDAIESGMGGAALKSGETVQGAISNMLAAFSRVGEKIVEAVLPYVKDFTAYATELADKLEKHMKPAVEKVIAFLKDWGPTILSIIGPVVAFIAAFNGMQKVIGIVKGLALAVRILNAAILSNPIVAVIAAIIAIFVVLYMKSETFRNFVHATLAFLWNLISTIVTSIYEFIVSVVTAITDFWNNFGENLKTMVSAVWQWISETISNTLNSIWETISNVFNTVLEVISQVLNSIWETIKGVFSAILQFYVDVWTRIFGVVSSVITTIYTTISTILTKVKGFIWGVLSSIGSFFSNAWNGIKNGVSRAFTGIVNGVKSGINKMIGFVKDIPNKIKNIFSGAGNWLLNAGKKIISGFTDGIKSMFGSVKDTLGSLTDLLPSWKGPAKKDRIILYGAGEMVMSGFQHGLEDKFGSVESTLSAFTDRLKTDVSLTATAQPSSNMSSPVLSGAPIFNIHSNDGEQVSRMVARRMMGVVT